MSGKQRSFFSTVLHTSLGRSMGLFLFIISVAVAAINSWTF